MSIKIKILLVLSIAFCSCSFLSTRSPEEPDNTTSSYISPTSPSIVVQNLITAMQERNTSSYLLCFIATANGDVKNFLFTPLSSVKAAYPSIFADWNLQSERTYLSLLISKASTDKNIAVKLSNQSFENFSIDSVVFKADYLLSFVVASTGDSAKYSGTLTFAFNSRTNGYWGISYWQDYAIQGDSIKKTWSDLKAEYSY